MFFCFNHKMADDMRIRDWSSYVCSSDRFDSPCLSEDDTTLKDCALEIGNTGLNFIPGNRFGYSGAGYQVAGYVATVVSGKSWSTLVNERLAGPLGMNSLTYGASDNPRIAGGAWSTAEDYLKFTQLYLDGGKAGGTAIITTAQVDAAKHNQVAGLPVYYTPEPEGSGLNGYSFGWWISDRSEEHTSELQSLMRISYAVFCLKKKKKQKNKCENSHTR